MKIFLKTAAALICACALCFPAFAEEVPSNAENFTLSEADNENAVYLPEAPAEKADKILPGGAIIGDETVAPSSDLTPQTSSHGEAGTGDIEDIKAYWDANGYPSDVSFAFNAGGELLADDSVQNWLEIGIVGATQERKQEILSLIAGNSLVKFIDCKHTYAEKTAVYDELSALNDERITDVIFVKNDDKILVTFKDELSTDDFKVFANELRQKYGTVLQVASPNDDGSSEIGADMGVGSLTGTVDADAKSNYTIWIAIACAFVFVGAIASFIIIRSKAVARQTANGTIIADSKKASAQAVKKAVKSSEFTPSDELFDRISNELKK